MTLKRLWNTVANSPEYTIREAKTPPTTSPEYWPTIICRDGHPGTPSEIENSVPFVLVLTDRHLKYAKALSPSKTIVSYFVSLFMEAWIVQYGIPNFVLTNKRTQFTSKILRVYAPLGTKQLTITVHVLQANGLAGCFKKTVFAQLRHYMTEHEKEWCIYVHPLM